MNKQWISNTGSKGTLEESHLHFRLKKSLNPVFGSIHHFLIDLDYNESELPSRIIIQGLPYYRYMGRIFSPIPIRKLTSKQSVDLCDIRLLYFSEIVNDRRNQITFYSLIDCVNKNLTLKEILDFGCGNGHYTSQLLTSIPGSRVIGADLSKTAIVFCKQKYPSMNWEHIDEDANSIDYPANHFDLILSSYVMHFDISKNLIIELYRILKSNGQFVFNVFNTKYMRSNTIKKLEDVGFKINTPMKTANPSELIFVAEKQ